MGENNVIRIPVQIFDAVYVLRQEIEERERVKDVILSLYKNGESTFGNVAFTYGEKEWVSYTYEQMLDFIKRTVENGKEGKGLPEPDGGVGPTVK